MRRTLTALLMLITMATTAAAEPAVDRSHASATPVEVSTLDGQKIRGSLLDLGPESVTILTEGERQTLSLARVARIQTPRDSLKNGFLVGAIVLGGWCAYICGQGMPDSAEVPLAVGVNALFGGLIGMALDAANPHRDTLYRQPGDSNRRLGMAFGFSW